MTGDIDPELEAMSTAAAAIATIEDAEARTRVIEWLAKKFGVNIATKFTHKNVAPTVDLDHPSTTSFDIFSDLYDATNPTTSVQRLLVGGYWIQVNGGQQTWDSLSVNKLLKDVGYGIESISHRLNDAQKQKPALVRQTSKNGKSRQARKTYRLTQAGIKFVENLLTQQGE